MFQSVASILQKELSTKKTKHIVTFCHSLDDILGGGIPIGSVTEIAGESGCGKTQLAFQLCVNVQIHRDLGGAQGEAIFVDTENTFSTNRLIDIAGSVVHHCHNICEVVGEHRYKVHDFLSQIYMFKCLSTVELIATIHQLKCFLSDHPNVRLMVVDSIAHCVRAEEDMRTRNKILNDLSKRFRALAFENNIAVVLINQVTTRFSRSEVSGLTVPALGATWSHVAATKIMLIKYNDERFALLYKSSSRPRAVAQYVITKDGFRDVISEQTCLNASPTTTTAKALSEKQKTITKQEIPEEFLQLSQRLLDIFCQEDDDNKHLDSNKNEMFNQQTVSLCDLKNLDKEPINSGFDDKILLEGCKLGEGNKGGSKRRNNDPCLFDCPPENDHCGPEKNSCDVALCGQTEMKPPLSPVLKHSNSKKRRKIFR